MSYRSTCNSSSKTHLESTLPQPKKRRSRIRLSKTIGFYRTWTRVYNTVKSLHTHTKNQCINQTLFRYVQSKWSYHLWKIHNSKTQWYSTRAAWFQILLKNWPSRRLPPNITTSRGPSNHFICNPQRTVLIQKVHFWHKQCFWAFSKANQSCIKWLQRSQE